jgi:peptide-methionine (S)-S-oxide reductase
MTSAIRPQDHRANRATAPSYRHRWVAGLGFAAALVATVGARSSNPDRVTTPSDATVGANDQVAVLSGGCFWGLQAVYEHVIGVTGVTAGYAGGEASTATYDEVSGGTTGHAESVRIAFDPTKVSYADLLKVFFTVAHNPTELNRQGPDEGPQYRSAIWYLSPEQHKTADSVIHQLTVAKMYPEPIVTQVTMFKGFYAAEAYHQDYAVKHPNAPYIVYNDAPKVVRLKKELPSLYRDTPVLFASGTLGQ